MDEAANHIKELVDPDANIIWGSAFNNDLDGRIRVSVVATGIEADAVSSPEPARVFAFPTARTVPADAPRAVPVHAEPAAAPVAEVADAGADELLLDSARIVEEAPADEPLELVAPIAAETPDVPSWLAAPEPVPAAAPEKAAPRVSAGGGTLFERMSNIARGAAKPEDGKTDPLDIPRFLNQQNNQ